MPSFDSARLKKLVSDISRDDASSSMEWQDRHSPLGMKAGQASSSEALSEPHSERKYIVKQKDPEKNVSSKDVSN